MADGSAVLQDELRGDFALHAKIRGPLMLLVCGHS
jgi:hypothetical protein